MLDCYWAETGQEPWSFVTSLHPSEVWTVVGGLPLLAGENEGSSPRGSRWARGLPVGSGTRGECGQCGRGAG